jgi:hypothetical protein
MTIAQFSKGTTFVIIAIQSSTLLVISWQQASASIKCGILYLLTIYSTSRFLIHKYAIENFKFND